MPTNLVTFAASEKRMRWKEPFVTEGLNAKMAVAMPPGTLRGFRLSTNGANRTVTVKASSAADHVAVYQTAAGYSLTLRKTGGDFNLDLSASANQTVVLAIYATYSIGSDTTAQLRAYQLSPVDEFTTAPERAELVILGKVDVPAAAIPIPADNIHHTLRTEAWEAIAPEQMLWSPVLRNTSFEAGETGADYRFGVDAWEKEVTVGTAFWRTTITEANSGVKSLELNVTAGAVTGAVYQYVNIPVKDGQLFKVGLFKKVLIPSLGGTAQIKAEWADGTGALNPAATTVDVTFSIIDGSFTSVEEILPVPSGAEFLRRVGLFITGMTWGASGNVARIDNFQLWLEVNNPKESGHQVQKLPHQMLTDALLISDPTSTAFSDLAALLRFDKSTPASEGTVVIERRNQKVDSSNLPPALRVPGRFILGAGLLATNSDALKPRISMDSRGAATYTLLEQSGPGGGLPSTRVYTTDGGGRVITVNAAWDGTNWNKDQNGTAALKILHAANSWTVIHKAAGVDTPWLDTVAAGGDWTQQSFQVDSANKRVIAQTANLGSTLLTSSADALTARVVAAAATGTTYTLMWESVPAGAKGARMYVDSVGDMVWTTNARWDGTLWNRDVAGDACKLAKLPSGMTIQERFAASGATWDDTNPPSGTGWDDLSVDIQANNRVAFFNDRFDIGQNLLGNATNAQLARVFTKRSNTVNRTLIWESGPESGSLPHSRLYRATTATSSLGDGFELTVNAVYDNTGALWSKDLNGTEAAILTLAPNGGVAAGFVVKTRSAGQDGTWADASWDTNNNQLKYQGSTNSLYISDGILGLASAFGATTVSNPAVGTTPAPNEFYAKVLPKAWGYMTTDGGGGVTIQDGHNIAATAVVGAPAAATDVRVTLQTAFANTFYAVIPTLEFAVGFFITVSAKTTSTIDFRLINSTTGATISLAGTPVTFSFSAHGKQ